VVLLKLAGMWNEAGGDEGQVTHPQENAQAKPRKQSNLNIKLSLDPQKSNPLVQVQKPLEQCELIGTVVSKSYS
jgi:hypothetical protein